MSREVPSRRYALGVLPVAGLGIVGLLVGGPWRSDSVVPNAPDAASVPLMAAEAVVVRAVVDPRVLDLADLPAPRVRAAAALVYNPRTLEVLWESGGFVPRPIASITKVMTALVLLDQGLDLRGDVVLSARDVRRASTTYLRRHERVTLDDLLHLALIASDNVAARVLARASGLGTAGFVDAMNRKADELGLRDTRFVDPSGLHEDNVSTPYDVARLVAAAAREPVVTRIMRRRSYRLRTDRRTLTVRNTNRLLQGRHEILAGKTGYIDKAGYCLAAMVALPGTDPLAVVVLGAGSNPGRFREVRRLADWAATTGRSLVPSVARAG